MTASMLEMTSVQVWVANGTCLLDGINWRVASGQHWALLGPNGAGKSTLLALCGAIRHPSAGTVRLLGGQFGRVDMRALRARIGLVDPSQRVLDWLTVETVVLTGLTNTIQPHWHRYEPDAVTRARELLALVGCGGMADREIKTLSHGERQRVRIARALMPEPELLLLDEPTTGLDLPAREALLTALDTLTVTHPALATILVSHHLEDLPASTSHALLLSRGRVTQCGAAATVLTATNVSACFGCAVDVTHLDGRWSARATSGTWRTADS